MALFGRKRSGRKPPAELVDIRDGDAVVDVSTAPPPARPAWVDFGRPTPCPQCGHNGYLDGIDVKRRVMFQHCPACAAKWDTTEDELLTAQ